MANTYDPRTPVCNHPIGETCHHCAVPRSNNYVKITSKIALTPGYRARQIATRARLAGASEAEIKAIYKSALENFITEERGLNPDIGRQIIPSFQGHPKTLFQSAKQKKGGRSTRKYRKSSKKSRRMHYK